MSLKFEKVELKFICAEFHFFQHLTYIISFCWTFLTEIGPRPRNILIQSSSLLSLSDLFLCALPSLRICSMGYKVILSSSLKQILSTLLKCLDTGPFLFLRISVMWLNILFLYNGLFLQRTYLHKLYIQWYVWHFWQTIQSLKYWNIKVIIIKNLMTAAC